MVGTVGQKQGQVAAANTASATLDKKEAPREPCEITDIRAVRAKKGQRMVQAQEPSLPQELQGHIGKHLRAHYGNLVQEPVPDKILEVLKQLEAKEKRGSQS